MMKAKKYGLVDRKVRQLAEQVLHNFQEYYYAS